VRHRPVAGLLLSLVVTATSGAAAASRIGTHDQGVAPAAAAATGRTDGGRVAPGALPPPPGKTLLVSRKKTGPGAPFVNAGSIQPSVSADGTLVAFASIATDLRPGDEPNTLDVFVIDRRTNTVLRAPRPRAPGGGIGSSTEPSISADGTVVAFTWLAPTPAATPTPAPPSFTDSISLFAPGPPQPLIYAWVLRTNRIELVSRNARGAPQPGANQPSISGNGRFVAYTSTFEFPDNGDDGARDVLRYDRQSKQTVLISVGPEGGPAAGSAWAPSISGNGNLVAFVSDGGDTVVHEATGERGQVYVRDVSAKRTTRVSKAADGGAARGPSDEPAISADGRQVAFTSAASNIVDGFSSQFPMVYRRNLAAGRTDAVTVTPGGTPSQGGSGSPAISADGNMVAFESAAADLAPAVGDVGVPARVAWPRRRSSVATPRSTCGTWPRARPCSSR
jgi:Tol biopolymer transport system component